MITILQTTTTTIDTDSAPTKTFGDTDGSTMTGMTGGTENEELFSPMPQEPVPTSSVAYAAQQIQRQQMQLTQQQQAQLLLQQQQQQQQQQMQFTPGGYVQAPNIMQGMQYGATPQQQQLAQQQLAANIHAQQQQQAQLAKQYSNQSMHSHHSLSHHSHSHHSHRSHRSNNSSNNSLHSNHSLSSNPSFTVGSGGVGEGEEGLLTKITRHLQDPKVQAAIIGISVICVFGYVAYRIKNNRDQINSFVTKARDAAVRRRRPLSAYHKK